MNAYNEHDSGYYKEQSTKPQTIGYALDDSPVGLAAWIVEKFRTWTDPDGDLDDHFTKDQLLDNLMVYWVTTTAHSSARMYYEFAHGPGVGGPRPVLPSEGAPRVRPLPERDHVDLTPLGRGTVHALAFRRHAAWRSLRRVRGAGAVRPRHPRVLPEGTVTQ